MKKTKRSLKAFILGGNKHPSDNCPEQARCFKVFTYSIAYLNASFRSNPATIEGVSSVRPLLSLQSNFATICPT